MMIRRASLVAGLLLATIALTAPGAEIVEWKALFNGKDATGWVQAKPGRKHVPWQVEDGALTNGRGGGMDLATEEEFDNYELELEYKLPPKSGNSGVYLRGQIELQIADSPKVGQIYSKADPKRNSRKPAGEWNQFRIRHFGKRITAWHNGVLIHDNVWFDGTTGGAMKISVSPDPGRQGKKLDGDRGPIMLQGDHSQVWYRNIRIRPLCSPGAGWKPLWNGKDLSDFTARGKKIEDFWTVDEKERAFTNTQWWQYPDEKSTGSDLWTRGNYGNFLVHYEYKSGTVGDGNSGFYLRDQWEIQIHKSQATGNRGLHGDGALYSLLSPLQKARHEPDEWNHMDVKVDGTKIWVWQNGKLIHDGVELKRRTDSNRPTTTWSKAPFKLQGDHSKVSFTNLCIKELPDSAARS